MYFDLGELRGYHYHTGPVFSAYVPGVGQAVANGGRYDRIGEVFGRARPATGFSTDLVPLISGADLPQEPERIYAPYSATQDSDLQQAIADLRAKGQVVVQALDAGQTPQSLDCKQQLIHGDDGWLLQSA